VTDDLDARGALAAFLAAHPARLMDPAVIQAALRLRATGLAFADLAAVEKQLAAAGQDVPAWKAAIEAEGKAERARDEEDRAATRGKRGRRQPPPPPPPRVDAHDPDVLEALGGPAPDALEALRARIRAAPTKAAAKEIVFDPAAMNFAFGLALDAPHELELLAATIEEKRADVREWRKILAAEVAERAATEKPRPARRKRPDDWRAALRLNRYGEPLASFGNLCALLRAAPAYAGRLSFDAMALRCCLDGAPLDDAGVGRLREAIERDLGAAPSVEPLTSALFTVASERSFHPIARYLDGLPRWDGTPRLAQLATRVLGLAAGEAETVFAAKLLRKWMVSCVARVRRPGCKVDTALVLVGDQGRKKSTFFAVLFGAFFLDCDMDIQNKDAVLQMRAGWCVEWGEVERVTSRKEADVVKAFVSRASDMIRPPYGRTVESYPRSSVIVGSTNKRDFLVDETGERRFWVIDVGAHEIDTALLTTRRDQLWAEALAAFDAGERWWLDDEQDVQQHGRLTRAYRRADPWEPTVAEWLRTRQSGAAWTDAAAVLSDALQIKPADRRDIDAVRVGKCMAALGWERRQAPRDEDPRRPWRYYRPKPESDRPPENPAPVSRSAGTSAGTSDESAKTPAVTSGTSGTSGFGADVKGSNGSAAWVAAAQEAAHDASAVNRHLVPTSNFTGATGDTSDCAELRDSASLVPTGATGARSTPATPPLPAAEPGDSAWSLPPVEEF